MKYIPGYEKYYSITTDGKVYSHPRTIYNSNNYPINVAGGWITAQHGGIFLHRNGKSQYTRVKDLIRLAYGVKPEPIENFEKPKVVKIG